MKRILFIFFVLASFVASAQRPPNYVPRNTNEAILRQWVDSTFTAPAGVNPSLRLGPGRAGPVFVDTVGGNKGLHYYRDGAFIRLVDTTMTSFFGGGSGSTITNIGNPGYDLAVSGTNNVKRFRDSIFLVCDTLLTGTIRCRVDTVTLGPWVRGFSPNLPVEDLGATGFPVLSPRSNKLFGRKISATAGVSVDTLSTGEIVLSADDSYFNQYFRLIGRAGGQVAAGGTGSGESLTLTSNFTTGKAHIFFGDDSLSAYNENTNRLGIGDLNPISPYSARIESGSLYRTFYARNISNNAAAQNVFSLYNDNADTSTAKGFQLLLTSSTYESAGVPIKNTGGLFNRYNGHIIFGTNAVERMRIDSLGNVGIGTTFPNGSSILDLSSTTKGFLPPRMNTTQQNAISSPATGLLIYNTDSSKFRYYDGSAWASVGTGSGGGFTLPSLTAGSVLFSDGTTIAQDNANFFWDNTNKKLGLGDTSPDGYLEIFKSSNASLRNIIIHNASTGVSAQNRIQFYNNSSGTTAADGAALFQMGGNYTNFQNAFGVWNYEAGPMMFATNALERIRILSGGNVGFGTTAPDKNAEFNLGTSGAVRLTYNDADGTAANYLDVTISSIGSPTFNAVGTSPKINFSDDVYLPANGVTASDLSLVGLDVDAAPDTLLSIEGGIVAKYVIPTVSAYAVADSLAGGKFTPTLVDNPAGYNSNVASSANVTAYYHKIGNIVTVWGTITAVATAGSTNSAVAVTLPIASNLAAGDVTGGAKWNVTIGVNYTDLDGAVNTDATNDRVVIGWNSHAATADHNIFYRYTYQVK